MPDIKTQDINALIGTFRLHSSYNFSEYSKKSLGRRIEKLLIDYRCDFSELLEQLARDADFLEEAAQKITVNTTELFRHPPMWKDLDKAILPALHKKKTIHIWHAACSSGQEVYSMLIMLKKHALFEKTRLIATDINSKILQTAQAGVYKHRDLSEYVENFQLVFPQELSFDDYFRLKKREQSVLVHPQLLNKAKFIRHDLTSLTNPYPAKYDIVMCRNVLIYFNRDLQEKLFRLFFEVLQPGGILVIGRHEAILGDVGALFEKQNHYYKKKVLTNSFRW